MPRLPILLLCSALLSGCDSKQTDEGSAATIPAVVTVTCATAVRGTMELVVQATGTIDALRIVKITAPVAGRIESLDGVEGTPVKRGDVIAVLQSREGVAAITGAEALLRSARTELQKSEDRRALMLARSTQNAVTITAPADGVIGTRSVNPGEFVAENGELVSVVDLTSLTFVADVPLSDLPQVKPGQTGAVTFPFLPGELWKVRVEAIYPRAEGQSQTAKVRLRFTGGPVAHGASLTTGMAGVARIVVGIHHNACIVPKAALLRNDETGTNTIVTLTPDSLAKSIPVVPGITTDSTVEVAGEGVTAGMSVIVEGHYALADSTKVRVEHAVAADREIR
jgi:membrane fusion protein, multidrug efflux system